MSQPTKAPRLQDVVRRAIIVTHQEDIVPLQRALQFEGFECEQVRGPYTNEQLTYPSHIKCLINHANAWRRVTNSTGFVLVVEADFVPVRGIANLPLPFVPDPGQKAMAWLYSVGPVIYHVDEQGAIFGHNAGTVAYVLDHKVAVDLLALFDQDMASGDPRLYRPWEVYLPVRLRWEYGVRCYIPFKMYGEHGGIANSEHKSEKVRAWHEADALAGSLHFLPMYAHNSRWRYYVRRLRGRARGYYRFITGKYFDRWTAWWYSGEDRMRKLRIAWKRLS